MTKKLSEYFYHQYFSLPNPIFRYYRNVRTGLRSTLTAINELGVMDGFSDCAPNGEIENIRTKYLVPHDDFYNVLKFTFIRNPYKRLESVFSYGIGNKRFFPDESSYYSRFGFSENTTFGEFVRSILTIPVDQSDDFICPQSYRLFDNGVKHAHFIAKLEESNEAWDVISRLYGKDIKFPFKGKSWRERRSYWTDDLKERVFDYYYDDFYIFGYDIESVPSEIVPNETSLIRPSTVWRYDETIRDSIKHWVEDDNNAVTQYAADFGSDPIDVALLLEKLGRNSPWINLGNTQGGEFENWALGGTWQTEGNSNGDAAALIATGNGSVQSAYAPVEEYFDVESGDRFNVSARVHLPTSEGLDIAENSPIALDGKLRIGLHVVDAEGKSLQWPSLFIDDLNKNPAGTCLNVIGEVVVTKAGAARARAWIATVEDAVRGQVVISDIRVCRIQDQPQPVLGLSGFGDNATQSFRSEVLEAEQGNLELLCAICGATLLGLTKKAEGCPSCGARARTRGLPKVINDYVVPKLSNAGIDNATTKNLPFLGFAMSGAEQRVVRSHFLSMKSASLYGEKYSSNHDVGVDVRNMNCYDENQFSAIMGVLLFDYFEESELALSECMRTLVPGGVFFTHIAPGRLSDGYDAPTISTYIEGRPGYFEYVPEDNPLPSIKVGRHWFLDAMRKVGFEVHHIILEDASTNLRSDWFIGQKPLPVKKKSTNPGSAIEKALSDRMPKHSSSPGFTRAMRYANSPFACEIERKDVYDREVVYTINVPEEFGIRRLIAHLEIPTVESALQQMRFAEHVCGNDADQASKEVIACLPNGFAFSEDLGNSWNSIFPDELAGATPRNCRTLGDGTRLIQTKGVQDPRTERERGNLGVMHRFSNDWQYLGASKPGDAQWHGTSSIDEVDGTIIFGEYHMNSVRYFPDFDDRIDELSPYLSNNRLLRSIDGGQSWSTVLELTAYQARHFHTVVADVRTRGLWWASTGDRMDETHVFMSVDDGLTWNDVTNRSPDVSTTSPYQTAGRSCFRYTDIALHNGQLFWGSDDLLGGQSDFDPLLEREKRGGSRFFSATMNDGLLKQKELGIVGNSIRSIVDIGDFYIATTEGRENKISMEPSVVLISKKNLSVNSIIFDIDNILNESTSFTGSMASRKSCDGTFFSYRSGADVMNGPPYMLRWNIETY